MAEKLDPNELVSFKELLNAIGKLVTPLPGDMTPRYICGHCHEELLSRINPIKKASVSYVLNVMDLASIRSKRGQTPFTYIQ